MAGIIQQRLESAPDGLLKLHLPEDSGSPPRSTSLIPPRDPTSSSKALQQLQGQGSPGALVAVDCAAQEYQVRPQQGFDLARMPASARICWSSSLKQLIE